MAFGTRLSLDSLLDILEGTAAATKADSSLVSTLESWIEGLRGRSTKDIASAATTKCKTQRVSVLLPEICAEYLLPMTFQDFAEDVDSGLFARFNIAVAVWCEISRSGSTFLPAELQKIWSLIFEAIRRTSGTRFQFTAARSAQGFISVALCSRLRDGAIQELFRFHVWLPDNQRGLQEVGIHAHQPFAQSWILAGFGENSDYNVEATKNRSEATHAIYIPEWSGGDQTGKGYKTHQISSTIANTGKLVRVSPLGKHVHVRNMSYAIPAGTCHGSRVPGGRFHATLFFFDASRGFVEDAMVVGPKTSEKYTQIRDPGSVTPMLLAEFTEVVRNWEQRQNCLHISDKEQDDLIAYYKFFTGRSLMAAGRYADASQQFDSSPSSLIHMFCKEPSDLHRKFIDTLIDCGVKLDCMDADGSKLLNYAISNKDERSEAVTLRSFRSQPSGENEMELKPRNFECL